MKRIQDLDRDNCCNRLPVPTPAGNSEWHLWSDPDSIGRFGIGCAVFEAPFPSVSRGSAPVAAPPDRAGGRPIVL